MIYEFKPVIFFFIFLLGIWMGFFLKLPLYIEGCCNLKKIKKFFEIKHMLYVIIQLAVLQIPLILSVIHVEKAGLQYYFIVFGLGIILSLMILLDNRNEYSNARENSLKCKWILFKWSGWLMVVQIVYAKCLAESFKTINLKLAIVIDVLAIILLYFFCKRIKE